MTSGRAFILCPRGTPRPDGAGFTHGNELADEIDAGLGALAARYGEWVDRGPVVYAGYSQGSYVGTGVVMKKPGFFSRVILIEGNGAWNEKKFAQAGGQRVLFACGTPGCEKGGRAVAARLEKAGVRARVVNSPGAGHTLGGAVEESVRASFAWVVEGDPRW
jgi:predicted esterase